jgi:5-methylcytosine-specific restriction endonuclease McrA
MKRSQINRGKSQIKRTPWVKSARTRARETKLAAWSRKVRERDGHQCQRCGKKGTTAHHKALRSHRPDLAFELSNGVTLCAGCHAHCHLNWSESVKAGWIIDTPYERREAA